MPTEAFLHLEEGKKNSLLKSAVKEFSALPYEKVSVFKIAQNAEVSRSGFYYYFKDKEDIYKYLLDQIKEEFIRELDKGEKKYDIFSFCRKVFELLAAIKGTDREAFFKQVFSNLKPDDTEEFFERIETCTAEKHFKYLCDLENLNISSKQELLGLYYLLISSTLYALQRYLIEEEPLETAGEKLDQMLEILKYGVLK